MARDYKAEYKKFQSSTKAKKDRASRNAANRKKKCPSGYASGALAKCRKVGAKNWGNKS